MGVPSQRIRIACLPVGAIFVEPHANGPQLFLLPAVLGTLESARKLLRAGHRSGYEFCTAFRALHRSRILFDRLTSIGYKYSFKNPALLKARMHVKLRPQHD